MRRPDRWVLYGIADCELYAFVEADASSSVKRLYWEQFESYLDRRGYGNLTATETAFAANTAKQAQKKASPTGFEPYFGN